MMCTREVVLPKRRPTPSKNIVFDRKLFEVALCRARGSRADV